MYLTCYTNIPADLFETYTKKLTVIEVYNEKGKKRYYELWQPLLNSIDNKITVKELYICKTFCGRT